ncbi:MAG: arylesterase [Gammaproteobacteria bacterium]|nr:arylesterase [Gammaproteobacteria bacterium]
MLYLLFKPLKVIFCLTLLMASSASFGEQAIKIMLFGDSLMAGYGLTQSEKLASTLKNKFTEDGAAIRIINASVSGNTSNNGLARIDWSLGDNPDVVVLCLGANDMLRGIDPQLTKDNLNTMIVKIKENGATLVFAGMRSPESMGEDYQKQFDQLYFELAAQHGLIFMPFLLEGVALETKYLQRDLKHPNALGIKVIANNLYPYLLEGVTALRAVN